MNRILVYGYGNPGRQDDGLGPALVGRLEEERIPGVATDSNYQLQIEDAVAVSESDTVIFVDAVVRGEEPFTFTELEPSNEITLHDPHRCRPASVLALCHELYRHVGAGLSPRHPGVRMGVRRRAVADGREKPRGGVSLYQWIKMRRNWRSGRMIQ